MSILGFGLQFWVDFTPIQRCGRVPPFPRLRHWVHVTYSLFAFVNVVSSRLYLFTTISLHPIFSLNCRRIANHIFATGTSITFTMQILCAASPILSYIFVPSLETIESFCKRPDMRRFPSALPDYQAALTPRRRNVTVLKTTGKWFHLRGRKHGEPGDAALHTDVLRPPLTQYKRSSRCGSCLLTP